MRFQLKAVVILTGVALLSCSGQPSEPMQDNVTLIANATILVGRDLEPLRDGELALAGEQIVGIGPRGTLEVPDEARRVDASGLVLAPGFIDAHVHIGLAPPEEVLRRGVTTVRDLAWPPEIIFEIAQRSRAATFDGPEVLAAGPMFTVPGGYPMRAGWAPPGTGLPLTSPRDARDAVGRAADAGAHTIKFALNPEVGPVLDGSSLKALVQAAHERGLKTTGHVSGLGELDKAIAAGVDELAHMLMSRQRIPQATIEEMVAEEIAVVPTLSVRYGQDQELAIENLERFHAAGGTVIYGTDLGNQGPGPGIDGREVEAMAHAGFTSRQIIASATVESAEWLGLSDRGVLQEGLAADIVTLPAAAQRDPGSLTDVRMVWRLGRRVS